VVHRERTYPQRGLHGKVVHELGVRIVRGEFAPGDSLPNEPELGEELEVSRSVLREGMKVLAGKGLVRIRPKTGTQVRPREDWNLLDPDVLGWQFEAAPTPRGLRDLHELRAMVECDGARLAAERRDDADVAALREHLEEMTATVENAGEFVEADLRFHGAIFEASGNELLAHLNAMFAVAFRAVRRFHTRQPNRYVASLGLHEDVLDAIAARDGDAAEKAMRVLTEDARVDLEHYIAEVEWPGT
jgi:GntR family transcriptional regulator, galactonate operon transcriptional repressor